MENINAVLTAVRGYEVSLKQAHRSLIGDKTRNRSVKDSPVKHDKRGRCFAKRSDLERFIKRNLMR
jgi:hypothetical protein